MDKARKVRRWIPAQQTQDGDGVKILRVAGHHLNQELDPFLLLDELRSDESKDYVGGFPPHPHRGFETITYMKEGLVRHKDHMGNEGVIGPGDVQWMTAGRGVIHSEMPEQQEGMFHGFQLWLNLPSNEKMKPAAYRDIRAVDISSHTTDQGVELLAVAGSVEVEGQQIKGPIQGLSTEPLYLDIQFPALSSIDLNVAENANILLYVYDGEIDEVVAPALAVMSGGSSRISLSSGSEGARVLLFGGVPLKEPVVQHGPFVMNTQEQINQAILDYQQGQLTD